MSGGVILLVIVLIIALVIFGPILTIWSLNILFPVLAIGYTFKTWLATLLLSGTIGAIAKSLTSSNKN